MRPLVVLLFAAASLPAAPVPKGVKKPPSADGVWECVEVNSDGRSMDVPELTRYCKIEGDRVSNGRPTLPEIECPIGELQPFTLRTDDPARPTLRTMIIDDGPTYSAVFERDGDTLRWAWCGDRQRTITECAPGPDVVYSVLRRVKEK